MLLSEFIQMSFFAEYDLKLIENDNKEYTANNCYIINGLSFILF